MKIGRQRLAVVGATAAFVATLLSFDPGLLSRAVAAVVGGESVERPTPAFVAGCPLVEPPVLSPRAATRPGHHVLALDLAATPAIVSLSGTNVTTHVFNPASTAPMNAAAAKCLHRQTNWLPPTLAVNPGDSIAIKLRNLQSDIGWHDNLHFHGVHVTPGFDPGTSNVAGDNVFLDIPPGGTQNYRLDIPSDHPVGTYWYHDHGVPTEPQLFGGQAGLIKIGNLDQRLPAALQHLTDHTLMLKDMQFVPATASVITGNILSGAPTSRLVNGELRPFFTMPINATQHWTFANTSADIYYDLQFDGHVFNVIGIDGNPAIRVAQRTHLLLPPGKRYDVLVQSTGRETVGSSFALRTLAYNQGTVGDLYPNTVLSTVRFTPSQQSRVDTLPTTMGGTAVSGPVTDRRTVYFNEDNNTGTFSINMRPGVLPSQVPLPSVIVPANETRATGEWTIANTALENHVFHIHINPFQVLAVSDATDPCNGLKPVDSLSLEDVLNLPQATESATPIQCPGEHSKTKLHYGKILFRTTWKDYFGTYPGDPQGRVMVHCHIEAHLDNGMMTWFEVIKQSNT